MANNQYVNKVVFGNQTIMDISQDNITPADLASGKTAHDKSGAPIVGTNTYDANTSDADAVAAEILNTKTAYVNGVKITGSMPNRGAVNVEIDDLNGDSIPAGYHDGSGTVDIESTEKAKIIASNIKDGVTILGVLGTYTGEGVTAQTKSATPYTTAQTILPDSGYDYLAEVDIAAISYVETDNAAGGKTVTIGDVAPTP